MSEVSGAIIEAVQPAQPAEQGDKDEDRNQRS
jgi:hypothetical protein